MFFFLTQFVQNVLARNPIEAGFAFLPMSLGMVVVPRTLTPKIVKRYSPKTSMTTGLLMVAAAMVWLTQISASTGYFSGIMLPMLLAGAGVGLLNAPLAAVVGLFLVLAVIRTPKPEPANQRQAVGAA
ncbi:hypothetical protein ACWC09_19685 [Streptomyces sp. NPDC001617]